MATVESGNSSPARKRGGVGEQPPPQTASAATIRTGEIKFIQECSRCHVLGPSSTPDLRRIDPSLHKIFKDIVLRGAVAPTGMERFDDLLTEADVDAIHAYLIDESWKAYRAQQASQGNGRN